MHSMAVDAYQDADVPVGQEGELKSLRSASARDEVSGGLTGLTHARVIYTAEAAEKVCAFSQRPHRFGPP